MNIVAVIPARYQSSRLPGKPLADICGEPMIYWVYKKVVSCGTFSSVVCAIDDERIESVCKRKGINYILTSNKHLNHISRIHQVSEIIDADYYVCVNGDEPLIDVDDIVKVIPCTTNESKPVFYCAMRKLTNIAQTIDGANIKVVCNKSNIGIYLSRTPVPYPKGSLQVDYKKYVGIECFNKKALDFFVNTAIGEIEKIEDIDQLRFIENGIPIHFIEVESESISVDTPKDLDTVRYMISKSLKTGEYNE